jgi:D-xylose transport system substrate-binding protein
MQRRLVKRARFLGLLAVSGIVALVATSATAVGSSSKPAQEKPIVALLWPENVTPRWEQSDRPITTQWLKKLIPGVQVDSLNALNNPAKQLAQAEAELAKGAKVLIVAAIDQKSFAVAVKKAAAQGVPVIAYDRLIKNSPLAYYDSFNSVTVGKIEASWIAKNTQKGDRIVIINGSPTDDNAHAVNKGIHQVFDPLFKSGARVKVAEQWVPGWTPTTAQRIMEQVLTKANNDVDAVVSANDGMAGGIIAALKAQGLEGDVPTSGQDASLEGIQNVLQGYQGVTAFKDFRLQAPAAAQIAAAIIKGQKPKVINGTINNGQRNVPAVWLKVVPVSKANLSLLVRNGWIKSQFGGLSKVCKGMPKVSICA